MGTSSIITLDVYAIDDPRELVRKFSDAAEEAAYMAIQADREAHQAEMKYLDKVMDLHTQELSSRPLPIKARLIQRTDVPD